MNPQSDLEDEITRELSQLRGLLADKSTWSVAGCCYAYFLGSRQSMLDAERLTSPAKQIPFVLAVLLSSPEPESGQELTAEEWAQVKQVVERLFRVYLKLYVPSDEEQDAQTPEWLRSREVSMLAFSHYFNSGLMASVEQIRERITRSCVPFDDELVAAVGVSATHALAVLHRITDIVQESLDEAVSAGRAEQTHRLALLEQARSEGWSQQKLKTAASDPAYVALAQELGRAINHTQKVSRDEVVSAFPTTGATVWDLLSVARGEGPQIRYPTERSIAELKPLIRLSDVKALCGTGNMLFGALLLVCEEALAKSPAREKFLRLRDQTLEREVVENIRPFLSSAATIYSEAYERADSQYEHDVIVVDEDRCLIIEAKASPPTEPFRDPDKAFTRIRRAFTSDSGIQAGFEQSNRIVRRLKNGQTVALYDKQGRSIARLEPAHLTQTVGVIVTRDDFGALATNLKLLLEKDLQDAYPWVVNIIDLGNLGSAWQYFKLGPEKFGRFLAQRILLHGKVFSDDELDYAGYFIRHGSFDTALNSPADLLQLNPNYSAVFDEVYRHQQGAGLPVTLSDTEPVMMDLKQSLMSRQAAFGGAPKARHSRKIGRNEMCPCGSGKKYKHCCGFQG